MNPINGTDSNACPNIPEKPTKPVADDVCFGAESHPGTIAWRKVIEEITDEYADDEFGPPILHAIKNHLKNARFWVKGKHGEEEWKLASKGEMVRRFRTAFDTKKKHIAKDNADTSPAPPPPTKPVPDDVCFGAESHPGTIAWRKVVEEITDEYADDEFGPPILRAIKNRLKTAHFWVKENHGEEWKVAPKGERQF